MLRRMSLTVFPRSTNGKTNRRLGNKCHDMVTDMPLACHGQSLLMTSSSIDSVSLPVKVFCWLT
jgi:hypothetical protein